MLSLCCLMVKVLSRKVMRKNNVTLNQTTFEGLLLIKLIHYVLIVNSLLHIWYFKTNLKMNE